MQKTLTSVARTVKLRNTIFNQHINYKIEAHSMLTTKIQLKQYGNNNHIKITNNTPRVENVDKVK